MSKILYNQNKSFRLQNVLMCSMVIMNEFFNSKIIIEQMKSYIKARGATYFGPYIQYSKVDSECENELGIAVTWMIQCDRYISDVKSPYSMEECICVRDALYCRFVGTEDKMKYAFDKIYLEAFENDIELSDCYYLVFVSQEESDMITLDLFVPKK